MLNLAEVNYVDSAGLGALVSAYTTVTREGGTLKLANVTRKLQDLLSITKLLTVFETFDSEDEAVRSYKKMKQEDRQRSSILFSSLASGLPKDHNPVRVGAFRVVADAPAVRRLGELLRVDDDEQRLEARRDAARQHGLLELHLPAAHFADFERHVAPGRSTRASSWNTLVMAACHSATLRCIEISTADVSMPQNHPRSQLSPA